MESQIDWHQQWAAFAPGFREGIAHIPLENGEEIALQPGPGFGDASHPTTHLMLKEMAPFVRGKVVFDIGCGSGILSVAAGKLGASQIFAVDLDKDAEEHTRENAKLNGIEIAFATPFPLKPIVLMNMILTEQMQAWNTHCLRFDTLVTSGILETEKEKYLAFAKAQGWHLLHTQSLEGWLCSTFKERRP